MKHTTAVLCLICTLIFTWQCRSQDIRSSEDFSETSSTSNLNGQNVNSGSGLINPDSPSPIIFIYDASGSMWDQISGKSKMEIASEVLKNSVNGLPENQRIGLVAYGHRTKGDCEDVEFLVDSENSSKVLVNQSISNIKPLGNTPLAFSVLQVIDNLKNSKTKATVILLTDGNESCNGDLCEVVKAAKKEGIDFKLHIIGFGLKESDTEKLECSAIAGDGQYYEADDAGALSEVLNMATGTSVDEPAGNLSLYTIVNGKPVDCYIKILERGSSTMLKAIRTYGDTSLVYLPAGVYDIEVKPLEGSDVNPLIVNGVESFEGKVTHRTISFDGSKLIVNSLNNGEGWDAIVKVYEKDNNKSIAQSRTYGKKTPFELNPGVYDITIQAMVIEGIDIIHTIENVEIKGGVEQNIEHIFKSGIVMIGAKSGSELVDATVNISEINSKKNIANSRTYESSGSNPVKFVLSPGTYEIIITALGKFKNKKEVITLTVKEGETTENILNF